MKKKYELNMQELLALVVKSNDSMHHLNALIKSSQTQLNTLVQNTLIIESIIRNNIALNSK